MHPPVETVFRHETVWYTEWIAGKIPILLTLGITLMISQGSRQGENALACHGHAGPHLN